MADGRFYCTAHALADCRAWHLQIDAPCDDTPFCEEGLCAPEPGSCDVEPCFCSGADTCTCERIKCESPGALPGLQWQLVHVYVWMYA